MSENDDFARAFDVMTRLLNGIRDEAAEAEWYAHVMAQYDETRREASEQEGGTAG